jgi:hypothetical protein
MRAIGADAGAVAANLTVATLVATGTAVVRIVRQIRAGVVKRGRTQTEWQSGIDLRATRSIRVATFVVAAALSLCATEFGRFEGRRATALHPWIAAVVAFAATVVDTGATLRALLTIAGLKVIEIDSVDFKLADHIA